MNNEVVTLRDSQGFETLSEARLTKILHNGLEPSDLLTFEGSIIISNMGIIGSSSFAGGNLITRLSIPEAVLRGQLFLEADGCRRVMAIDASLALPSPVIFSTKIR